MDNIKRKKILIIDDDAMSIAALTRMLRSEYNVFAERKGRDGVDFAVEQLPDIILLDVEMPDMDGFETLKELRNNPLTASIPVIFVTGMDNRQCKEKALRLGASDYIVKPAKENEILSVLSGIRV